MSGRQIAMTLLASVGLAAGCRARPVSVEYLAYAPVVVQVTRLGNAPSSTPLSVTTRNTHSVGGVRVRSRIRGPLDASDKRLAPDTYLRCAVDRRGELRIDVDAGPRAAPLLVETSCELGELTLPVYVHVKVRGEQ